jgi:ribosome recycling factor
MWKLTSRRAWRRPSRICSTRWRLSARGAPTCRFWTIFAWTTTAPPRRLNQVANLHVPEPSLITIQPWDVSQIGPIEKSIRTSDLGLNPSNDGKVIRLPIPPLTEERRKELVKRVHAAAEHHRVALRNVRREGNEASKKLLKDKKITEDEDKKAHDEIQKMTDSLHRQDRRGRQDERKRHPGD